MNVMAKLSTPYHKCEQRFAPTQSGVTPHCPWPAYRKHNGHWLCKTHTRAARAHEARQEASNTTGGH